MADQKPDRGERPRNVTISLYPDDEEILREVERLSGTVGPTEIFRRGIRVLRLSLLEEEARAAELRRTAQTGASS